MNNRIRYILFFFVLFTALWLLFGGGRYYETVHMIPVTDAGFDEQVRNAEQPVLVMFSAVWCGSCYRVTPVLDDLAAEYEGRVKFVTVDYDRNPELVGRYQVDAVPYVLLFQDGKAVDARVGVHPAQSYRNWIEEYL